MKRFYYAGAVLAVVLKGPAYTRADYLLWTDDNGFGPGGDIQRANLDGSGRATLVTGLVGPTGIAANPADGMMYWANSNVNTDSADIRRAKLDGSGQQIVAANQLFSTGVAVNSAAGQVYWRTHAVDSSTTPGDVIRRTALTGAGAQNIVSSPDVFGNGGLALDTAGGKIYYADFVDGLIRQANVDGSGQPTTLRSGLPGPVGIALDLPAGKMYWADFNANGIYRANLDGSDEELVLTNLNSPSGLALDLAAGKMYWTDAASNAAGAGDIGSANLDGTGEQILVTGLNGPFAITLVPEPSVLQLAGGGVAAMAMTRMRRRGR